MRNVLKIAGTVWIGLAMSAAAQVTPRAAVSMELSPQDAASAFEGAVVDGCIKAISGGQRIEELPDGARSLYQLTRDRATRDQVNAEPDEKVWDVATGRGVVAIKEKAGRCSVSVYGPPAAPTMIALAGKLGQQGFERLATAGSGGMSQTLRAEMNGRSLQVMLRGSDPGFPGHSSRFSVVTATVFEMDQR